MDPAELEEQLRSIQDENMNEDDSEKPYTLEIYAQDFFRFPYSYSSFKFNTTSINKLYSYCVFAICSCCKAIKRMVIYKFQLIETQILY